jgi:prevent-host-death family protein
MKTIEMAEATGSLSDYARKSRHQALIITVKGRPVAALTPIGSRTDLENLAVSNDPRFRALIARSRRKYPAGRGLTTREVRRRLQGVGRQGKEGR